ncbi:6,7-dimethyl-8-ribityllumazine synthase [Roseospira marina]|uniref:6,7-dimethyl-8-ribityllumazine synthase n=1 Tax=Roseospira marina TaxID=140057 RepID=A0A5M6I8W3_9PROT|nr:6,7-dimethyl-8-ribityllumazine synthase [Roseospira marina]KAA5604138.1 6,7-dimethyl-8-ribityllumazine synthase [Roseospira marina]MBB4315766.1 6,7-dimethyl-8-ribityllumazine synthase [Roseospira marina]MBB5088933.1 6,7-dimethyl-8-ribityllumazine synthase [Roseospira marina]
MTDGARILIVEARFYEDIADQLVRGCVQELTAKGAGYKRIIVPGILEIPAVVRYAVRTMELRATDHRYAGYVVLGCAIKGETDHYEHVCHETMSGVSRLVLDYSLALGNGILTCPTRELAMDRARTEGKNLGGKAARACLRMIEVKRELGL